MKRSIAVATMLHLTATGFAGASDAIWTNKPVRVDPATQNFERLPGLVMGLKGAETVTFPVRIDMHDSASFAADGVEYVLADLKAIAQNRICTSEAGARWACGAQANIFVGNLFRGRTLVCSVKRIAERVELTGCRTTRMNIPGEIVSRGFAFPSDGNADLDSELMKAQTQRSGVWKDAACAAARRTC